MHFIAMGKRPSHRHVTAKLQHALLSTMLQLQQQQVHLNIEHYFI